MTAGDHDAASGKDADLRLATGAGPHPVPNDDARRSPATNGGVEPDGLLKQLHWKKEIWALFACHLLANLALFYGNRNPSELAYTTLLGLVASQCTLTSVWAGLSHGPSIRRLLIAVVISQMLAVEVGLTFGFVYFWLSLFTGGIVAVVGGVTSVACWLQMVALRRADEVTIPRKRLQFTIRHLVFLTFGTACVCGVGKWLIQQTHGVTIMNCADVAALCSAILGFAAVWAILGVGNPLLRSLVVVPLVAASGWIEWTWVSPFLGLRFWATMSAMQAAFLVVSLAVLRAAGYRVAWGSR